MSESEKFIPLDDEDKNAWDICAPIFNHFFIIGPGRKNELETLYHYPEKKTDENYAQFLLPDGVNLEPLHFKNVRNVMNCFSSINEIIDNIIYYKVEGSSPVFVYACIFKATPLSYPGIIKAYVYDQLLHYKKNFETVPQFKCGFVFVTSHPFHDLYFDLLKTLVNLEFQTRNTLKNLMLLSNDENKDFDLNPTGYWPYTIHKARMELLEALYNSNLPVFGEALGIKFNIANLPDFTWNMPTRELMQYSPAAVGFEPFMQWINTEQYVRLIECLMVGCYFVVTGTNYKEITKTISFLPNIIAPFTWAYTIVSFVPLSMIDTLGSPVPYIMGVFIDYLRDVEFDPTTVFIYVDSRTIEFPEQEVRIPERLELIDSIDPLFLKEETSFVAVQIILKLTQDHIFRTIISKMQDALECRLDVPEPGTTFHTKKFNEQFDDPEDLKFIEQLEEQQIFHCLVCKLCRINTRIHEGNDASLEGLGEWAASIWKMQHQNASLGDKTQVAVNLLNTFDPYG
jgi:hypothetical protein